MAKMPGETSNARRPSSLRVRAGVALGLRMLTRGERRQIQLVGLSREVDGFEAARFQLLDQAFEIVDATLEVGGDAPDVAARVRVCAGGTRHLHVVAERRGELVFLHGAAAVELLERDAVLV